MVEPLADRDEREELARGRREPLDAQHQRVAQRVRRGAPAVRARGEQLLAEQRVAAGPGPQPIEQLGRRRRAEDVGELVGELVALQRAQDDPPGAGVALELGQQATQRVAAVQLVGPVGGDDEHALAREAAGEERERRARRAGRPVQVLDHEQHRALAAERVQQRQQALEQARLPGVAGAGHVVVPAAQSRQQRRDGRAHVVGERGVPGAGERAQRGDERQVGQLALAEVDAVAGEHERAGLARAALDLGEQPRLADPRLAGEEHERRAPVGGVRERRLERGELGVAADQPDARHARRRAHAISRASLDTVAPSTTSFAGQPVASRPRIAATTAE